MIIALVPAVDLYNRILIELYWSYLDLLYSSTTTEHIDLSCSMAIVKCHNDDTGIVRGRI